MSEEQLRLGDFRSVGEEQSSDEIPVGYKKTEIGIIPEDWRIAVLSELCQPNNLVRGPFGGSLKKESFVQSGYKVYEQGNAIYADCYLGKYYISEKKFKEMQRFRVDPGDFIISCSGTIGKIFQIPTNAPLGIINQALLKIKVNQEIVLDKYFFFVFIWEQFQSTIIESIQGGAMKNLIGMREFRKVSFALPPISEQHAIAEVLTDVDNLIESLDNLISKKQAIKKATMQQLLTGRTRLPGFKEEWNHTKLGEVLKVCHGRNQRGIAKVDGRYPILASGGEIGRTDHSLHDGPSVLIGRKGTIDQPQFISSPFWTVDTLFYTSLSSCAFAKFIYYKFCLIPWKIYNEASGVPSLNAHTIEQIEIMIPSIQEQQAIVSILSDMDAEIEALERQRDKMKQIKQGMMQQLLTGRIRLLDKEAV